MNNAFGEKIKALRTGRNETIQDAAHVLGIPWSRLSELEKGVRIPVDGQIERMAQHYGVSAEELTELVKAELASLLEKDA